MCTTQFDIQRWLPSRWEEFVGNEQLTKHLRNFSMRVRMSHLDGSPQEGRTLPSLLITGGMGEGKTAVTRKTIQTIACHHVDQSGNPCNRICPPCREGVERLGQEELFAVLNKSPLGVPVEVMLIDCGRLESREHLESILGRIQDPLDTLRIVYMDEAQELGTKGLDKMMRKPVEDRRCLWIFSTAFPDQIDSMLRRRFIHLRTQRPSAQQLGEWLVHRCNAWDIPWSPEAICLLADKSGLVPGIALQCLALAANSPDGLTPDLVANEWHPNAF